MQKIIRKYISLSSVPLLTSVYVLYDFPKVHPPILIDTFIISIVLPIVDNRLHLQLYRIESPCGKHHASLHHNHSIDKSLFSYN